MARTWRQPGCPSIGGWIEGTRSIRRLERHSAIGREVLPFATPRRGLGARGTIPRYFLVVPTPSVLPEPGRVEPREPLTGTAPRSQHRLGPGVSVTVDFAPGCLACPGWSSPGVGPAPVPPWVTTPQALSGGPSRPSDTWAWCAAWPRAARQCSRDPRCVLRCNPQGGGTVGRGPYANCGGLCPPQWAGRPSPSASWAPGSGARPACVTMLL